MLMDDKNARRFGPAIVRFHLREIQRIAARAHPAPVAGVDFDDTEPPKYSASELRDFKRRGLKFNNE